MFSTTGQVGLMFIFCGLGFEQLAFVYLLAHAIWRSYQFLHAPAHMHLSNQSARSVPPWLKHYKWLYTAAVQRFWLDNLSNALFVKPINSLANEIHVFDEQVVNRIAGMQEQVGALTSLTDWENRRRAEDKPGIASGRGVLGKLLETVATALHWFEEHLVLKSGGDNLINLIHKLGYYAERTDKLLSQPRYLWLLILTTLVVII